MIKTEHSQLLELPPVGAVRDIKEKRPARTPDLTVLYDEQRIAYDEINAFLESKESGMWLLEGYAGTGKSFLTNVIIEDALVNKGLKVAATATTNKAVKVLHDFGEYTHPNLAYATIHSILALKEQIQPDGRQLFVQTRPENCTIHKYDLIIIDEVSQLADELFELIYPYLDQYRLKILFIGDPCQIPPVGKEDCIPLSDEGRSTYNIGQSALSIVRRQAEGNPIISMSMKIRRSLNRSVTFALREDNTAEDGSGVYFVHPENDKRFVNELLTTYFNSPNFEQNTDFFRVIAWTNKVVDKYNVIIRKKLYGADSAKICIGERLVANRPIIDPGDNRIIFNNNDEFKVLSFDIKQGDYDGVTFTYYDTKVVQEGAVGEKIEHIRIIHEDSDEDFDLVKGKLIADAKELTKSGDRVASVKAWTRYYNFLEIWADVKYCYAITAHKSQGSSYENALVIESDINKNVRYKDGVPSYIERNRIKYTAVTRPKKMLFILSSD